MLVKRGKEAIYYKEQSAYPKGEEPMQCAIRYSRKKFPEERSLGKAVIIVEVASFADALRQAAELFPDAGIDQEKSDIEGTVAVSTVAYFTDPQSSAA